MKNIIRFLVKLVALVIYPFYYFYSVIIDSIVYYVKAQVITIDLKRKGCIVGSNLHIGKNVKFNIRKGSEVRIGRNVVFGDNTYIKVRESAKLIIGNDVHINVGTRISSFELISIGDSSLIASFCNILDHNHTYDLSSPASTSDYEISPIKIGKGVWLGTKVQINKGVQIGDYTVIGANAVVTKDLEPSSVYVGIPARKIN